MECVIRQRQIGDAQVVEKSMVDGVLLSNTESIANKEKKIRLVDGSLSPLLFSYWSNNSEDCAVVEKLQLALPEGTQIFGFEEEWSEDNASDESVEFYCHYRALLWPPLDCDAQEWCWLTSTDVYLLGQDDDGFSVCTIPFGIDGFTIAQAGRAVLSRLMLAEKIARERVENHSTEWFGEIRWKELFLPFKRDVLLL